MDLQRCWSSSKTGATFGRQWKRLGLVVDTFGVREDADNEEFGTAEWIRLALQAKKITVSEART
jgi:hypothetical protein